MGLKNLPLSMTSSFFRIFSIVVLLTYLNNYGFISIVVFWITNMFIFVKCLNNSDGDAKDNSTWLVGFVGLFVPVYFYPQYNDNRFDQRNMSTIQRKIYRYQNVAALICYLPSLLACLVITNIPCNDNLCYRYQKPDTVIKLDNLEFNWTVGIIIVEGIIANILSLDISFSTIMSRCKKVCGTGNKIGNGLDETSVHLSSSIYSITINEKHKKCSSRKYMFVVFKYVAILVLCLLPILCGTLVVFLEKEKEIEAYIYSRNDSNTLFYGTVVSKQSLEYLCKVHSNEKFKCGIVKSLIFPNMTSFRTGEVVATTIKHLSGEKKNETESTYKDEKALLVYEEKDYQRPSSPVPQTVIETLASKQKLIIIHVKNGFFERKHFNNDVAIFFKKDHKDDLKIAFNGHS